jgi:hypothetical protein
MIRLGSCVVIACVAVTPAIADPVYFQWPLLDERTPLSVCPTWALSVDAQANAAKRGQGWRAA